MIRHTWSEIQSRITSVSIAGIGSISWTPKPNERKICEEIVTYLEDQGILHSPFQWEHPKETYLAAAAVRAELTKSMQKLNRDMGSFVHLGVVREALKNFQRDLRTLELTDIESKSSMTNEQVYNYDRHLVSLRNTACLRVAVIGANCQFSISNDTWNWIS